MTEKDIAEQLSFFEKKVLKALLELGRGSPEEILRASGLNQLVEVMNASSWLQAKGLVKRRVTRQLSCAYQSTARMRSSPTGRPDDSE
mgnify:CR=1 FL=1